MSAEASHAAQFVRIEAAALFELADRLEHDSSPNSPFLLVLALLSDCTASRHRILLTGMGKSGIVARKIASTLRSTGAPAHYLNPAEAVHGDLGMVVSGDVVVALSYSGETEELLRLLPSFAQRAVPLVALTGSPTSTLAKSATLVLDCSVSVEACPLNLAPTASTTVMLALGDALALELARRRGFSPEHFAELHPGGNIGRRLARVEDRMHRGYDVPRVALDTPMSGVIYEMSRKKLGMTVVVREGGRLAGMISDGDLRRLLEREGANALTMTAGEFMNPAPLTVAGDLFAEDALALMEARKITSLIVIGAEADPKSVEGVVHMHDLLERPFSGS